MTGKLEGSLVVIVAEADGAPRMARLADELRAHGGRVAVFASDGDPGEVDAVVELVAELGGGAGSSGREREAQ
ncbi:MAG: hypothetical protein M3159_07060 [Actinomycetota bacterium]|nr:hypothetical protein [Actinomycetota bacterium]